MEFYMDLTQYLAKPNKTIAEHTKELLDELDRLHDFGYIPNSKIYELTKKACEYHDIGKVNREFQRRVRGEKGKFDFQIEVFHNVLSGYFVDRGNFDNKEEYLKVLFAVLYHHNYCDAMKEIKDRKALISGLLNGFDHFELKGSVLKGMNLIIESTEEEQDIHLTWIKGLLHKCDYSASAGYPAEYRNKFLNHSLENLLSGWKEKRPDIKWNDLQQFCIQNTNDNIIGIAQTGMGKTEGGLLWIGDNKGFFVLPLRTAINAIYNRIVKNILMGQEIQKEVGILHSESLDYYLENILEEKDKLLEYEQRGKALALPLNISTMDQLFDFVFKYPAYELKLVTLAYSKIVIDEIQMYEPKLLAYLIYGLKMVHSMGGKIAIVTATFPPFLRNLLSPLVFREKKFTDHLKRHCIEVRKYEINAQEIYDQYIENLNVGSSNKILVVCNTIKKAQQLFKELIEEYGVEKELHILHSRFTKMDRAKREKEVVEFGKTFNESGEIDKGLGIWISTSLVEASLDIDFDVLFTELKDLSSLFQRLGRCNRKGVKDLLKANCFVYTEIEAKTIQNGRRGFIDREIYELSKVALGNISGILSEEMKMELIEEYFTYERLKDSNYIKVYDRTIEELKSYDIYKQQKEDNSLRNILSEDMIPYPVFEKNIEEIKRYEKELQKPGSTGLEIRELVDKLNQYTVSVPGYIVKNYERAVKKKVAIGYEGIKINDYRKIRLIECTYEDMGLEEIDFENLVREPNML